MNNTGSSHIYKNHTEKGTIGYEEITEKFDKDADEIISLLEKLKREEETKYEQNKTLFEKLGISLEDFDEDTLKQLSELSELQYQLGCNDSSYTNLVLHGVEQKAENLKQQRQIIKLKIETKKISKVAEETKILLTKLQREYNSLQKDNEILNVDVTEQTELQEKIKRYKAVLNKFEVDPKYQEFNLSDDNIKKYESDLESLKKIQREIVELSEKLSKYMGASPDIDTLCKQTEELEIQYKEIQQEFRNLL